MKLLNLLLLAIMLTVQGILSGGHDHYMGVNE